MRPFALLPLLLVLGACREDSPAGPATAADLRGRWTGVAGYSRFTLDVINDNAGGFSGTARWYGVDTVDLILTGQRTQNSTALMMDFGRQHVGPLGYSCDLLGIENPSCVGNVVVASTADLGSATTQVRMTIVRESR